MNNIKDYLSEKTYELLDGYSGKPIAHFKIQTSRDSLEFHQEMWKVMCEKTGLKFYPVI